MLQDWHIEQCYTENALESIWYDERHENDRRNRGKTVSEMVQGLSQQSFPKGHLCYGIDMRAENQSTPIRLYTVQ